MYLFHKVLVTNNVNVKVHNLSKNQSLLKQLYQKIPKNKEHRKIFLKKITTLTIQNKIV